MTGLPREWHGGSLPPGTPRPTRQTATVECRSPECPTVLVACDECGATGKVIGRPPDRCRAFKGNSRVERCGGVNVGTGDRTPPGLWSRVCDTCGRRTAGSTEVACGVCHGTGRVLDPHAHHESWIATVEQDMGQTYIVTGPESCPECGSDNIEVVGEADDGRE